MDIIYCQPYHMATYFPKQNQNHIDGKGFGWARIGAVVKARFKTMVLVSITHIQTVHLCGHSTDKHVWKRVWHIQSIFTFYEWIMVLDPKS